MKKTCFTLCFGISMACGNQPNLKNRRLGGDFGRAEANPSKPAAKIFDQPSLCLSPIPEQRLNRVEFANTLKDGFGIAVDTSSELLDDPLVGFFRNNAQELPINLEITRGFLSLAEKIAGQLGSARSCVDAACLRSDLEKILTTAFRGMNEPEDETYFSEVVTANERSSVPQESTLASIFLSPKFLFRADSQDQAEEVSDMILASRLSYFLWVSSPDEELYLLAMDGKLKEPKILVGQVHRMIQDKKFDRFVEQMAAHWFSQDKFQGTDFGAEIPADTKKDLRDQTIKTIKHLIAENRPMDELIHSDYMMLSERIRDFHGESGLTAATGAKVSLTKLSASEAESHSGILTNTSILTASADESKTIISARGYWILDSILCTPPAPPPDEATAMTMQEEAAGFSSKLDSLQAHLKKASCKGCHQTMDGLGSGLENFDRLGKWREDYSNTESYPDNSIHASFTIGSFSGEGIVGVKEYILNEGKDLFHNCMIKGLASYAFGSKADDQYVKKIAGVLDGSDRLFRDTVEAIVLSKEFRSKWQSKSKECGK